MTLPADTVEKKRKIKYIFVDRQQVRLAVLDMDRLIDRDHPARAIWEMVEGVDVSRFEEAVASWEGEGGRPRWSARVLMSVLLYGYSQGVSSARELERLQAYEPGLRWLCGDQTINHHTMSDFRVQHGAAVENLFAQILGVLSKEGLVKLETVMVDGTKVEAVAGKGSYHRRPTLEEHIEQARQTLREVQAQSEEEREKQDKRRQAAQERAARERVERMEESLAKLQKLEAASKPEEREKLRVSETEAEARKMKFEDGGWNLAYNVQVTTEASHKIVVGVGVTTEANDVGQLVEAVKVVKTNCEALPQQAVTDNGYASRENVEKMDQMAVTFIAPWKEDQSREAGACKTNGIEIEYAGSRFGQHPDGDGLVCKAGKKLVQIGETTHHGLERVIYEAKGEDCAQCEWRSGCCGKRGEARRVERVKESEAMQKYLERMKAPSTQELYKKRKEVAEFPHLWFKGVQGLRRFRVRGPTKVKMEAIWIAMSYNLTRLACVRRERKAAEKAAA